MEKLERFATEIRLKTSQMLRHVGYGHLGAALSTVETLAVLYDEVMKYDVNDPESMDRDWFVLSKGHGGPSYYATLSMKGFFDDEELFTLNQNGTNLPSHPDRLRVRGVDVTTGSLGQGVSQAVGVAKGLKVQNIDRNVFCIVGDGECNEGQVFEAAQFAVSKRLDNFILYIDDNKKQLDGTTEEISIHYDFEKVFKALGFNATKVDGSSTSEILEATHKALAHKDGKPHCIVLDTTKSQGIKYFEDMKDNHHVRFDEEGLKELDKAILKMEEVLANGNA